MRRKSSAILSIQCLGLLTTNDSEPRHDLNFHRVTQGASAAAVRVLAPGEALRAWGQQRQRKFEPEKLATEVKGCHGFLSPALQAQGLFAD